MHSASSALQAWERLLTGTLQWPWRRGQLEPAPDSVIVSPDFRTHGQSAAQREVFLSD